MFLSWQDWFASGRVVEPELEILSRTPRRRRSSVPLVFVHGAFAGAWCWEVNFFDYFAAQGYECHALSLRGHGGSRGKRRLQQFTLDDYVNDIARVVADLDHPPVLIGHSMGGFLIQRFLERGEAAAAVLLASVPPSGLMDSSMRMMMRDPMLVGQLMLLHMEPGMVNQEVAKRALFSEDIPPNVRGLVARNMQSESQFAMWEMHAGPRPNRARMKPVPIQVLGADADSLIAPGCVESTGRFYDVDVHLEPGMGHAMMLEPGWPRVAERIRDFLEDALV